MLCNELCCLACLLTADKTYLHVYFPLCPMVLKSATNFFDGSSPASLHISRYEIFTQEYYAYDYYTYECWVWLMAWKLCGTRERKRKDPGNDLFIVLGHKKHTRLMWLSQGALNSLLKWGLIPCWALGPTSGSLSLPRAPLSNTCLVVSDFIVHFPSVPLSLIFRDHPCKFLFPYCLVSLYQSILFFLSVNHFFVHFLLFSFHRHWHSNDADHK